jgi:hypothetical protein
MAGEGGSAVVQCCHITSSARHPARVRGEHPERSGAGHETVEILTAQFLTRLRRLHASSGAQHKEAALGGSQVLLSPTLAIPGRF